MCDAIIILFEFILKGIRAAVSENGSEAGLGRSDQQQMLYNLSRIFSGGSSSYAAQAEIMYNNQDDDSSSNEEDDEGYMDTEDAESEVRLKLIKS